MRVMVQMQVFKSVVLDTRGLIALYHPPPPLSPRLLSTDSPMLRSRAWCTCGLVTLLLIVSYTCSYESGWLPLHRLAYRLGILAEDLFVVCVGTSVSLSHLFASPSSETITCLPPVFSPVSMVLSSTCVVR